MLHKAILCGLLALVAAPNNEAKVRAFVDEHQAELSAVLESLKNSNPSEYDRALQDLGKTVERLRPIKERDPGRHELELRHWKSQSHIDLLAARLQLSANDELKSELKSALAELWEIKFQLLTAERARTAERLRKLEEQIDRHAETQAAAIEKRYQLLTAPKQKKPLRKSLESDKSEANDAEVKDAVTNRVDAKETTPKKGTKRSNR